VRGQSEAAGLTGRALDAAVEGVTMRLALDALASGTASPAGEEEEGAPAGAGPDCLPLETAWLTQVAEAFAHSPLPGSRAMAMDHPGEPVDGR
jgi:hypothetical protein